MNVIQKNISLTAEDIQKIKSLKKRVFIGAGIFGLFFFGLLFAFGFKEFIEFGIGTIFIGVFTVIALCAFIFIIAFASRKYNKDIAAGQKKYVKGKIIDKQRQVVSTGGGKNQSTTYYYYLFFEDLKLTIDRKHYFMAEPGQEVEIETTLESASVLSFNKTGARSSTPIGPQVLKTNTVLDELETQIKTETASAYTFKPEADREELMSDLEIEQLKDVRKSKIKSWALMTLVSALVFLFIYYGQLVILILCIPGFLRAVLFYKIFWILVFILFRFYFYRKKIVPLNKDIADGKKILKEKFIEEKIFSNVKMSSAYTTYPQARGDYYYIKAASVFTGLSKEDFDALRDNEAALFHVAPHSGITLLVKPLKK